MADAGTSVSTCILSSGLKLRDADTSMCMKSERSSSELCSSSSEETLRYSSSEHSSLNEATENDENDESDSSTTSTAISEAGLEVVLSGFKTDAKAESDQAMFSEKSPYYEPQSTVDKVSNRPQHQQHWRISSNSDQAMPAEKHTKCESQSITDQREHRQHCEPSVNAGIKVMDTSSGNTESPTYNITCDFTNRSMATVLLTVSENTHSLKIKQQLSNLSSKSFGPWNSKKKPVKHQPNNTSSLQIIKRSSLESTKVHDNSRLQVNGTQTENKRTSSDVAATSIPRNKSIRKKHAKTNDISHKKQGPTCSLKENQAKSSDVSSKFSSRGPCYVFRHLDDVRDYMCDYKEQYCVGSCFRRPPVVHVHTSQWCSQRTGCWCTSVGERQPLQLEPPSPAPSRLASLPFPVSPGAHIPPTSTGCTPNDPLSTIRPPQNTEGPLPSMNRPPPSTISPPMSTIKVSMDRQQLSNTRTPLSSQRPLNNLTTIYSTLGKDDDVTCSEKSQVKTNHSKPGKGIDQKPVKLKYTSRKAVVEALRKTQKLKASQAELNSCTSAPHHAKIQTAVSQLDISCKPAVHTKLGENSEKTKPGENSQKTKLGENSKKTKPDESSKKSLPRKRCHFPDIVPGKLKEEQAQIELTFHGGRYKARFTLAENTYDSKNILNQDAQSFDQNQQTHRTTVSLPRCDQKEQTDQTVTLPKHCVENSTECQPSPTRTQWKALFGSSSARKDPFLSLKVTSVDGVLKKNKFSKFIRKRNS